MIHLNMQNIIKLSRLILKCIMYRYISIAVFKIISILFLTINCLLIYFRNYSENNIKQILSKKSDLNVDIQSLMKYGLVEINDKQEIDDSIEKESNVPMKYYKDMLL